MGDIPVINGPIFGADVIAALAFFFGSVIVACLVAGQISRLIEDHKRNRRK